jgi:hypothetical protein
MALYRRDTTLTTFVKRVVVSISNICKFSHIKRTTPKVTREVPKKPGGHTAPKVMSLLLRTRITIKVSAAAGPVNVRSTVCSVQEEEVK